MSLKIKWVKLKGKSKDLVELCVLCGSDEKRYTISEGTYREVGCPLSDEEIDDGTLEKISHAESRACLKKALSILSYGDNSKRRLAERLVRYGFSKDLARAAVIECCQLGYLDEERQLKISVSKLANSALFGREKILPRLVCAGYPSRLVLSVIDKLVFEGEIDFERTKATLIEKKLPSDASDEERKKLLYKYGHTD